MRTPKNVKKCISVVRDVFSIKSVVTRLESALGIKEYSKLKTEYRKIFGQNMKRISNEDYT